MTSQTPRLPIRYVFLPNGRDRQVVDFWSGLFVGQASLEQFLAAVRTCVQQLRYDDVEVEGVTFSGGIVGVEREMLRFDNKRAAAAVYFKWIGGFHYVSLRVYYSTQLSVLKFSGLVLLATVIAFLYESSVRYGLSILSLRLDYAPQVISRTSFWVSVVGFSIALYLILGFASWLRAGSFNQFLMQDFNELYRDDIASIGEVAYAAIHSAVDQLSLQAVIPKQENPPPAFGAQAGSASSKRRI